MRARVLATDDAGSGGERRRRLGGRPLAAREVERGGGDEDDAGEGRGEGSIGEVEGGEGWRVERGGGGST